MAIFDFLLKNPGVEARSKRLAAERGLKERSADLAEQKFQAQQEQVGQESRQKQIAALKAFMADPKASDEGKVLAGERLTALMPKLAAGLPEPQLPQPEGRTGVSLFDFSKQPVKTSAEQKALEFTKLTDKEKREVSFPSLTPEEKKLGNIQVIQDPNDPSKSIKVELTVDGEGRIQTQPVGGVQKSARDQAFERLTPAEQEAIVKKGQGATVSVSVDTGKEDVTKTVRSKIQDEIRLIDDRIIQLDEIDKGFEDQFLTLPGKLRTGLATTLEKFASIPPGKTEKLLEKVGLVDKADVDLVNRKAAFMLPAYTILNETIKEITGAAVRKGEEGRLGASTVDPTRDSPTQFRAKSKAVRKILIRQRKERAILLQRGLEYNKENVEAIPEDNVDAIYKAEVLDQPLSTKEQLQSKVNVVKQANDKGVATVSNAPSEQSQPQTLQDKIALQDTAKAVKKENGIRVEELLVSHPQSISAMQRLIKEEQMDIGDVGKFLKFIKDKGLSDEQVIQRLKRMGGGQ